jgi:hypothetical protein
MQNLLAAEALSKLELQQPHAHALLLSLHSPLRAVQGSARQRKFSSTGEPLAWQR